MLLKELIKTLNTIQFRIYAPNRDCLVFESYMEHNDLDNHYSTNKYSNHFNKMWPEMTNDLKEVLNRYGEWKVFSIEMSSFIKKDIINDIAIVYEESENMFLPCIDIFIKKE